MKRSFEIDVVFWMIVLVLVDRTLWFVKLRLNALQWFARTGHEILCGPLVFVFDDLFDSTQEMFCQKIDCH